MKACKMSLFVPALFKKTYCKTIPLNLYNTTVIELLTHLGKDERITLNKIRELFLNVGKIEPIYDCVQ